MEDELLKYGLDDSINTYDLAVKYINTWPENERRLSNLNRAAGLKGFMIDEPMVDAAIKTLRNKLQETEDALPWVEAKDEKPTSPHAIRAQGRKEGIEVPASLAKDNPEVIAWQEKIWRQVPWVKAISEYRSINTLLKRVESIKAGIRPDGTMPYQLKILRSIDRTFLWRRRRRRQVQHAKHAARRNVRSKPTAYVHS